MNLLQRFRFPSSVLACFLLTVLQPLSAGADSATIGRLTQLFERSFFSHYEAGRCGDNITQLVQMAQSQHLNLDGGFILLIQNQGYSTFGLVNAEQVRGAGRLIPGLPANERRYEVGEKNWYHHVILYYDGVIFDFDFGNEPRVLAARDYFEQMFLNEKRQPGFGGFYVGREEKLKNYKIELQNAIRPDSPETSHSLGEFLLRYE